MTRRRLGDGFSLWPHVLVRGAGFPVASVRSLEAHEAVAAADALLDAEEAGAVDAEARTRLGAAWGEAWQRDRARWSAVLRSAAGEPHFREAVLWQNRAAVADGLDRLLEQPPGASDSRTRKKELLVASYLQRYATKCDTIGFFGPVGFGVLGDGPDVAQASPGRELLDARDVYFEPWAVVALARAFERNPLVRDALPLRVHPAARRTGNALRLPDGAGGVEVVRLTRLERVALEWLEAPSAWATRDDRSVKGRRTRSESKADVLGPGGLRGRRVLQTPWARAAFGLPAASGAKRTRRPGLTEALFVRVLLEVGAVARRSDAQALVASLLQRGWVLRGLEVAIEARPEQRLRAQLQRLPRKAGKEALTALDEVEARLEGVRAAQGNAAALAPALSALEETFTRVTGEASTRGAGQTYAGRTLVYEECRRAGTVELGEPLRATLEQPLGLLLLVARWYTDAVATAVHAGLVRCHQRLGGGAVPLVDLWLASAPLFDAAPPPAVKRALRTLQGKLSTLFAWGANPGGSVEFSSAAVGPALRKAFAATTAAPGWPGARHHAPDVMLARVRDRWFPVLGELHPGVTPFCTLSVLAHCPVRPELERLFAEDVGPGHVHPIPSEAFGRSTHDLRLSPDATHLDLGSGWASARPWEQVLDASACTVRLVKGRLVVCGPTGQRWDALDVFERRIKLRAAAPFSFFPVETHRPRIWLDGLVVAREAWRFAASAFTFASAETPQARFLGARAFQRRFALPRHVFVKTPDEVKPVYLDFEAPALVEMVARQLRQAPEAVLSEMLPTPEQAWLPDGDGRRYVSELRLVAVDDRAFPQPR